MKVRILFMLIAAAAAIACCVLSYIEGQYLVALLSLMSSFFPIVVWCVDTSQNNKKEKMYKEIIQKHGIKLHELEDSLTWEDL